MSFEEIFNRARNEKRAVLTEIESKRVLKDAGIPCTDTRLARTREEAIALGNAIGYPLVLKISARGITHKSDAGGVRLNLQNGNEVGAAYDDIVKSTRQEYPDAATEGVTVQAMARAGVEVVIGMTRDPKFGPVLMFGLGGILVEVLEDVSFRIAPLEKRDAVEMLEEIKGRKLLEGHRGREPADKSCLANLLLRLSALADSRPEIAEVDMNPVFAYRDGAVVADARIILAG